MNSPSPLFSIPTNLLPPQSGAPAAPSPADASETSPNEAVLSSVAPSITRYARKVPKLTRDIAIAIAEAIDTVAIPAAEALEGCKLSATDFAEHGLREQRAAAPGKIGQSVEFFWKHKTVALLVVTETEDGQALVEAEAGHEFGFEAEPSTEGSK